MPKGSKGGKCIKRKEVKRREGGVTGRKEVKEGGWWEAGKETSRRVGIK